MNPEAVQGHLNYREVSAIAEQINGKKPASRNSTKLWRLLPNEVPLL